MSARILLEFLGEPENPLPERCGTLRFEVTRASYHSSSPEASAIFDRYNTGYLDLAGNCRLAFDRCSLERRGFRILRFKREPSRSLSLRRQNASFGLCLRRARALGRPRGVGRCSRGQSRSSHERQELPASREWIDCTAAGLGPPDEAVTAWGMTMASVRVPAPL